MTSAKFEIEKFDCENDFSLWRIKISAFLQQGGLAKNLDADEASKLSKEHAAGIEEKAHSVIQLSLADTALREVANEETTKGIWDKLESLYMTKSLTNRLYLKQRLYTLRMEASMFIYQHLDNFNRIIMDLKNIDVKVDEEDQTLILLCLLPISYDSFVNSMLYERDSISLTDVNASLNLKELRTKLNGEGSDDRAASLFVKGKKGSVKGGGKSKKDIKCHYCHQFGHYKSECPMLKKRDGQETDVEANVGLNEDSQYVLSILAPKIHSKDEWILDSGCFYHVSRNRDAFTTYNSINGGTVLMGNNISYKIVGIGSVRIRFHDGALRTLTGVCRELDLQKSLVSLSSLDSKGCRFSARGGVLRVCRGVVTMMTGRKIDSLYILQAGTVSTIGVLGSQKQVELQMR